MKKLLSLILIYSVCPYVFSSPQTSLNSFEIPIEAVPPGGIEETVRPAQKSEGLSDGAVTAITLGSVFGGLAVLGGLGWYFAKHSAGLACGCACGIDKPVIPICLADFCKDFSKNKYLEKAFALIRKSSDKKYLFAADSEIKEKSCNTIIFEIPKDLPNFRIIQVSDGEISSKIIVSGSEIPARKSLENGVSISKGKIPETTDSYAALVTENHSFQKKYAVIVEFSKE